MASSDRQPEGHLMEEFDGKQAELVDKLSEISTSMRQCADIVDSFTRIVRQISFKPMAPEAATLRQPPGLGPSRGSGSAPPAHERPDLPSARPESIGSPSHVQGAEAYRRPAHYAAGTMRPPAVPTIHSAGVSALTSMPSPLSYPLHRPSSATSATGTAGLRDAGGLSRYSADASTSASERRAPSKHGKRKRPQRTESGEFGDESEGETGTEASVSEIDQTVRQPSRHPAGSLEGSLGARVFSPKGQVAVEGGHAEDRPPEPAAGPSIVVFSSGAGSSRSRAVSARGSGQPSSSRSRKEKKPRDPNAPKQPPPAYIVYQNEIRESMRNRFPTHSPTELVKEIAATWKTLSNEERQRYKDYANVEKDRWVTELAAYQASLVPPDEAQAGKSSEGSFLATAGVSDSPPPASSPRLSPSLSDTEAEYKVRLAASQDLSTGSSPYPYPAPVRAAATFPGTGVPGMSGLPPSMSPSGESGSGRASHQGYSYGQDMPPRPERSLSRLGYSAAPTFSHMPMPSPPAGRSHFPGHMESRVSSTRLPSFESLGLPLQAGASEPSPGPTRERSGTEGEPAPKRQKTRTNPSSEEEGDGGLGRLTHEGRESE